MMKLVLDTNVFISGIFWRGNFCSQIIDAWRKRKFILVSSMPIVEELVKTLETFRIQMGGTMIEEWRRTVIENSIIVEPSKRLDVVKEDQDDNKFLEAALAGNAEYILSQDKHLLKLQEFEGIKILKPEEFVRQVL